MYNKISNIRKDLNKLSLVNIILFLSLELITFEI
jgi:hypothetical protein